MSNKILSFDVDSVLLDTEERIFQYIHKTYDKKIGAKDVTHWTYYIENFPSVLQYFGNPEIYQKVEAVKGMVEIMGKMIKKYKAKNIQLITSSHPDVKESKEAALNRLYGHLEDWQDIEIIHVGLMHESQEEPHHKYEYSENTILIDDAIHNVDDHLNYNHYNQAVIVDYGYGWNQGYENDRCIRLKDPKNLFITIDKLLGSKIENNKRQIHKHNTNRKPKNNSRNI